MRIAKELYDLAMDTTMMEAARTVMDAIEKHDDLGSFLAHTNTAGIVGAISRTAWELTRTDLIIEEYVVTDRVRELGGDEERKYWFFGLVVFKKADGKQFMAFGYAIDHDNNYMSGSDDVELFALVQQAMDEVVVRENILDPETGELLLGKNSKRHVGDELTDVVVRDIDKQVESFAADMDAIFGVSPSPGWDPPTPKDGG